MLDAKQGRFHLCRALAPPLLDLCSGNSSGRREEHVPAREIRIAPYGYLMERKARGVHRLSRGSRDLDSVPLVIGASKKFSGRLFGWLQQIVSRQ